MTPQQETTFGEKWQKMAKDEGHVKKWPHEMEKPKKHKHTTRELLLEVLADGPKTTLELIEIIGRAPDTTRQALRYMRKDGVVYSQVGMIGKTNIAVWGLT